MSNFESGKGNLALTRIEKKLKHWESLATNF